MQQAGQVPHLDQNDALEQSLGQSDGSLPGPEQTLNQSINQSNMITAEACKALIQAHRLPDFGAQLQVMRRDSSLLSHQCAGARIHVSY